MSAIVLFVAVEEVFFLQPFFSAPNTLTRVGSDRWQPFVLYDNMAHSVWAEWWLQTDFGKKSKIRLYEEVYYLEQSQPEFYNSNSSQGHLFSSHSVNLAITVFENRDAFDGATAAVVPEHFRGWAATAPKREQGTSYIQPSVGLISSQRYRYCLQVGREELESVLRPPEQPISSLYFSFVRLVDTYWEPTVDPALDWEEEHQRLKAESEGYEWIYETDDPIEGCRDWDVGWMSIQFDGAMVGPYADLRHDDQWEIAYSRPPRVTSFG
ncbi:hypothetical protein BDW66DRAFT_155821 [Aspergillus desertorum]